MVWFTYIVRWLPKWIQLTSIFSYGYNKKKRKKKIKKEKTFSLWLELLEFMLLTTFLYTIQEVCWYYCQCSFFFQRVYLINDDWRSACNYSVGETLRGWLLLGGVFFNHWQVATTYILLPKICIKIIFNSRGPGHPHLFLYLTSHYINSFFLNQNT